MHLVHMLADLRVNRIHQWKHWEDSIKKDKYDQDKVVNKKVTHVHQHAFIKEHFLGIGFCSTVLSWLGHNVVLISNHQTETEPMIIALLLETSHPHVAEKMTYVVGDRVVTDPVCKPFNMGRNLVCVYSKKDMHDIPELVEMKKKANTLSLKEMALLLRMIVLNGEHCKLFQVHLVFTYYCNGPFCRGNYSYTTDFRGLPSI
ncbi:uncharacterized protein LOC131225769 [Magnolia sinica]|uniref:uncharacterized protein LOC131225769 n=1 Tax=Magnolia sinica TaxID=86752 RepID=UPI0026583995|nr:uncharacterized protein LOC131225769 [Magnolia sinica]